MQHNIAQKTDTTDFSDTFMLVKLVNECAHAVIPQLDHPAVQTGQNPWSFWMEA